MQGLSRTRLWQLPALIPCALLYPGGVHTHAHMYAHVQTHVHTHTRAHMDARCVAMQLLYNDISPMENHHLATTFQLMAQDHYNFLARAPKEVCVCVRACKSTPVCLCRDAGARMLTHRRLHAPVWLVAGVRRVAGVRLSTPTSERRRTHACR